MSTPKNGSSRQHGPAGRKVGRAFVLLLGHAAAIVVLAVLGIVALSDTGVGLRENLAYGRDNTGRMCMGGLPHNLIGTITGACKYREIHGVGGQIAWMAHGSMTRTGPSGMDEAELLAAAERLASYLDETSYLHARAWCSEGPFVLFQPAESIMRATTATLATAAAAWAVLFISGRALFTFGRGQIANRIGRARTAKGRCAACGYALDGLEHRVCPECGKLVDRAGVP